MNEVLMNIVLDLAAFLELSPDDLIQLDAAVHQLDYLAYHLDQLSDEDSKVFADYVRNRIAEEQQTENRPEYLAFLSSFLEALKDDEDEDDEGLEGYAIT